MNPSSGDGRWVLTRTLTPDGHHFLIQWVEEDPWLPSWLSLPSPVGRGEGRSREEALGGWPFICSLLWIVLVSLSGFENLTLESF